mmetsp:Transcript_25321/g.24271  ORF Transcript_25321/g.24271 Transcript_25321/m.24271 type:complete len:81 (+) Transcript_25321:98-340(+)
MAQSGIWDIDGTGMKKIDDPNLAKAFMDEVNSLNIATARDALLSSAIFAVLPQSVTYPVAAFTLIFAALYYIKFPDEGSP